MSQLSKSSLCKWKKKDMSNHFDMLSELVNRPAYLCVKCGRAANKKRNLCKAKSITIAED